LHIHRAIRVPSLVEIAPGVPELCPNTHTHTHTQTYIDFYIYIDSFDFTFRKHAFSLCISIKSCKNELIFLILSMLTLDGTRSDEKKITWASLHTSGSGFPSNATLIWIFYSVTATCFGLHTLSSGTPELVQGASCSCIWFLFMWDVLTNPSKCLRVPSGVCEFRLKTTALDNQLTDGGEVVSLKRRLRFTPPERFLVLISIKGWVNPRAIAQLEELNQLKKKKILPSKLQPSSS
jgi:hypothetical protein